MNTAIITAGGSSERFKGENKLLYKIHDKSVIELTVEKFLNLNIIDEIILSTHKTIIPEFKILFEKNNKIKIIEGGKTRQESVYNALRACNKKTEYVLIHDGARPFVTQNIIINCYQTAQKYGAAITAVKTIDTVKMVDCNGTIVLTPDRNSLWNAQTPQIFEYNLIMSAHEQFKNQNYTDDSALIEKLGKKVYISEGEYFNFKITTKEDIQKLSD